jgi:type VI secretion system protein ImpL
VREQVGELNAAVSDALVVPFPGKALPETARRALQRRFERLHPLLDEQQNPSAELTQAMGLLDELRLQLTALSRDSSPEHAAFKLARQRMDGRQPALSDLRDAAARRRCRCGAGSKPLPTTLGATCSMRPMGT